MCFHHNDNFAIKILAKSIMVDVHIHVIRHQTARWNVVVIRDSSWQMKIECVCPIRLNAMNQNFHAEMENAYPDCGHVMVMMIVAIIVMKIQCFVLCIRVVRMNSVVVMDVVYSKHGNVIMKMTVGIIRMRKTVNIRRVLMANSPVRIINAYRKHNYAMELMIAKIPIQPMKTI